MSRKSVQLRFFTRADNKPEVPAKKECIGYISKGGKLIFPHSILADLPFALENQAVRVGVNESKRHQRQLYLFPGGGPEDGFTVEAMSRGLSVDLASILKRGGLSLSSIKYSFLIRPFVYENQTGMILTIRESANIPA